MVPNDLDRRQIDASNSAQIECPFFNSLQFVTLDGSQGSTVIKRILLDHFHAGHDYFPQGRASTECMPFNLFDAMMTFHFFDVWMPIKCIPGNKFEGSIYEDMGDMLFINAYLATIRPGGNVGRTLLTAYNATKDEYADVYASKLEPVISILSVSGTQRILEGDNTAAQLFATLAAWFEDLITMIRKNQAAPKTAKVIELGCADDHTLVSYFRKRIPCSCLDEKYKEVKSVKKMGICYNLSCSLPGRKVERSKMFSCARCGAVNYCSVECQKIHWKNHRQKCRITAEVKAAFDSEQS